MSEWCFQGSSHLRTADLIEVTNKEFTLVTFAVGGEESLAHLHILLQQFEISGLHFVCIIFRHYNF